MSVRSQSRVEIADGIQDLWGYLSDLSRWPEWATAIRECRLSGGAPLQAGSRLEQQVKGPFGSTRDRTLDVSAVDAPRRLALAGTMGPSPLRWGFDLTPLDADRTEAMLWVEVESRSAMRAVPGGMLKGMIRRVNKRELVAIKSAAESTRDEGEAAAGV